MQINIDRLMREPRKGIFWSVVQPLMIVRPYQRAIVIVGQFASSVAEMVGLAMIVPLLSAISFGPESGAHMSEMRTMIIHSFDSILGSLGLKPDIGTLTILIVGLMTLKSGITVAVMRYIGDLMADITASVRVAIVRNLLDARWAYFSALPLGRLVNATGPECAAVGESFLLAATILSTCLQILGYTAICLLISWELSILMIVIALFMFGTFGQLVKLRRRAHKLHARQSRQMAANLADAVLGMKPIKAMGLEATFASLFERDAHQLRSTMRTKVLTSEFASELQEPILAGLLCIGLYFATSQLHLKLHQELVLGLLLIRTIAAFAVIQRTLHRLTAGEEIYRALSVLLAGSIKAREVRTGTLQPSLDTSIELRNLRFAYGRDRVILNAANWTLPAGQVVALIGPSGAGKSTIVDLITGLRVPAYGQVLVDGSDLQLLDLMAWRNMIGYVPQEVALRDGSIFENVTLGESGFTEADVEAALHSAGAMPFVERNPERLHYTVGERGHRLSGGQRQRIAIARALLRRPRLLILDEATTGLDIETEEAICKVVMEIARSTNVTVLAISHHAIWAEIADLVFTVGNGAIQQRAEPALSLGQGSF
jgi:ATP-binding cassette subfamily C protein